MAAPVKGAAPRLRRPAPPLTPPEAPARRWPRRLMVAGIVFLVLCLLGTGGGYVYVRWRLGQIHRLNLNGLVGDDPGKPMNVLLVGSDSRARLSGEAAAQAGKNEVGGERSDTIMVLHADPRERKAAILSIPRDLYVRLPNGRSDRVNTAYSQGGAQALISTISRTLGIQIHHYVEVDFVGFKDIVDAVGGINMYVPAPARDSFSGLRIGTPGCVRLDGTAALAWVRSRHYEYYSAGRWREDPRGDLGRIQRQQDFMRRIMKKAVSSGLTNPLQLNRLIGIGVKDVNMDRAMSTRDIVGLAKRFRSLNPDSVDMLTLPATPAMVGGASVLKLQQPEAQTFVDRLNGNSPAPSGTASPAALQPAEVRLRVLNGNGADGTAAKVSEALQEVGFNVADRGDADSFDHSRTLIRYAPGQTAKAQLLQRYLQGGGELRPDATLRTVDLALVVGTDYTGVRARPAAPAPGSTGPAPSAAPPTTLEKLSPVPVPKGAPAQPAC